MNDIERIAEWLGSGSINIFGVPFAGKDTQGERLARDLGAIRLSGGEILRNSVIPPHVKEAIDAGQLAPTKEYVDIVLPYLSRDEFKGKPLVLSSVGRWKGEEQGVLEVAEKSGHPIKAVLLLSISEETLRRRWRKAMETGDRGERADDAEHLLDTRLAEYREKTLPVIDTYRQMGLLFEVSTDDEKDIVYQHILDGLLEFTHR